MKYQHLIQICEFLQKFKTLSHIKRVGDNLFKLSFDSYELFFDMNKTACNIHKNGNFVENKIYKAPFDGVLAKRLVKSKIVQISVPKNNRILHIKTELKASYKAFISNLYFEFTGRFTNVIITDEKGIILEALRHLDNDIRSIRVGRVLTPLPPTNIKEKEAVKIENFDEFFVSEFEKLNSQNLVQTKNSKLMQIDKKLEILRENLASVPKADELLQIAENSFYRGQILSANLYNLKDYQREFSLQ
ncbi:MAG: NFACT family protein, partial [Campylobacter sp.]|nr:NFACT family protein [Campylobacter sp.]